MIILTLRTEKPEAELGLYNDDQQIASETWQAHRELAETIHLKIRALLDSQDQSFEKLQGVVIYKGPGSFTGLRIGITVANALADSLKIPIIGEEGEDWLTLGLTRIIAGENDQLAMPEYGALPNITAQKK